MYDTDEERCFESRADFEWLDCDDPIFCQPDYEGDALAQF